MSTKKTKKQSPCNACPHNGEMVLAEAQAQYLEHVIEEQESMIERLKVCGSCRYVNTEEQELPICELASDLLVTLRHPQGWTGCFQAAANGWAIDNVSPSGDCTFSPSRWKPYWE